MKKRKRPGVLSSPTERTTLVMLEPKSEIGAAINALVVFVDVRGFTPWAEKTDVFVFIDEFGVRMQQIFAGSFRDWKIKNLGDGAMLIRSVPRPDTEASLQRLLVDTLRRVRAAEDEFSRLCKTLSVQHGSRIPLRLGWGITKGHIKLAGGDYIGADINKSSRLCAIARPFGVVIDRDDFPSLPRLPKALKMQMVPQVRRLRGIPDDVNVWVSKEIATQFITRENLRETPEVHIAGLCIKDDGGILHALIAKRSDERELFGGLYEGCGGQLARSELFASGVKRHFKLELQLDVDVVEEIHSFYYIHVPKQPIIPGISFLCTYKSGEATRSPDNHSEVKWVTEEELRSMPSELFIQDAKQRFLQFIEEYRLWRKKGVSAPHE